MHKAHRSPPPSGFATWLDHHLYSLMASLGRAVRKPWATLLTIGVMAVALSLPLGLGLVLANVERFAGNVREAREMSVFLKQEVAMERARILADELRGRPDVATLEWKTPDEGLAGLRENPALGDAIDQMEANPLPHLYIVVPKTDETALARHLGALPEVELVQHDVLWRQRLDQWLAFGERLAWVLAVLLGAGALLVVGNTVRLDIQSRREEIGVLQLLGATDGFIRRPFLYLGAWYGLAAGALALALLTLAHHYLAPPLAKLAASYGSRFVLQGFNPLQALAVAVAAGLLGWLGAGLVTGHYLRQTRPER
ncbi:ABC transporter permease [Lysobacter pythonis]|uniref:Cell division protein FtsX n=1 Tax=Solilutibacter pythonis TaxID=2483112 RepID=A0A3M2I648_9GAMM|nr:permease-like cell division protein FtsX [Lysobacter pythonis]RMH93744.1 ABC transporter permease [Lysobacter pythonis]